MKIGTPRLGALSLVELLTVLAVIAVLAVLAGSVISSLRVAGQKAACASNQRQIGAALVLYCNEHDGQFPGSTHGSMDYSLSWIYTLAPYLGELDKVRICPADPHREERLANRLSSYILNEYIAVVQYGFGGVVKEDFTNLRRLDRPDRTITVFTISDRLDASITNDHTHSREWPRSGWNFLLREIQPDRFHTGGAAPDHSKGSANYLYADGHVENIPADELKRRIEAGENIALPPTQP